jgi:hypothetical protein
MKDPPTKEMEALIVVEETRKFGASTKAKDPTRLPLFATREATRTGLWAGGT